MAKEISFLASSVSSVAGYHQDRNRRHLTNVTATLPEDPTESGLLEAFNISEILEVHDKDEFLSEIGIDHVRNWLEQNE